MEHRPDTAWKGLVSGAGRTVQGGQNVEEGVAGEELEKDVAKGFSRPGLALGPCPVSTQEILKQGSGVAEHRSVGVSFPPPPRGW